MNDNIKIIPDGFCWLLVTDKAIQVFNTDLFSLFILYDDDSESLIEDLLELELAIVQGCDIGIPLGFIK